MIFNNRHAQLRTYPFQRLLQLLEAEKPAPGLEPLNLAVGEPQHPTPRIVLEEIAANFADFSKYPPLKGTPAFGAAAAGWLRRRFRLPAGMIEPARHILPTLGTKEALFMIATAVVPESKNGRKPVVLMPDPFYQVYLGAAVFAGAEPVLLPARAENRYLPDLDAIPPDVLERTVLAYLCSPANPQGMAADLGYLKKLIGLARRHDFIVAFDECYTEIYHTPEPVTGALEAVAALGGDLSNVITYHSLSKRSSAPGLRSGFVAGHAEIIDALWRVRLYGGAAPPLPLLAAATRLWSDDAHVAENRALYTRKLDLAQRILGNRFGFYRPDGGFFLWLDVGDGERAARELWTRAAIRVLPGGYFAHDHPDGSNAGRRYIRVALVHEPAIVEQALERLADVLQPFT